MEYRPSSKSTQAGDKTLKLWEVTTGTCLRTFEGHEGYVNSVCLSADNCFALSGSGDRTLKLWEVATGICLRTFEGHEGFVTSVCLSADGRFALSGSAERIRRAGGEGNTLKLWDVATGNCLRTFEGHKSWVDSVCLSANLYFALSGSADGTVKLWELSTQRCLRTFEGKKGSRTSVYLNAGNYFAIFASNGDNPERWSIGHLNNFFRAPFKLSQVITTEAALLSNKVYEQELQQAQIALKQGNGSSSFKAYSGSAIATRIQPKNGSCKYLDKFVCSLTSQRIKRILWKHIYFLRHKKFKHSCTTKAKGGSTGI
ncbi:WD40 repeat domain-containing protein [Plectonema radiosum NIES-515]|uniref:WD40 repeat domain-containing protein n=1 Tax=Plectonema radiosum NIES-515 TaxID=2986073 RepID=A0ABT3B2F1_9CYAN|nr:WD40 repeat domain-containing protein [Plectonema radiosum]MCV3215539.1 WD40 repeat domain-containing protein [Plectonema radiosum NIES-515]